MDEPDLPGPSDDALSLSDDVDDAEISSDDAAGVRRRARMHLFAAQDRPDDAECTEEEFLVKLLIEDDISMDQERLFRILILFDEWNRRAPRPRDHGDPVTQGIHQTTNPQLARAHFEWVLEAPELVFRDLFRMPKAVFFDLCKWLRNNTIAGDSQEIYLEQKLLIILWIFAFGAVQRNTAGIFSVNQSTVSRVFHKIIGPLLHLHNRFVIQPTARELSPDVELDRDSMQFNGAIGAIDGTYIRAFIALKQQGRWWSRKSQVSQNMLAAVNLEGRFVYVLAGAEGSIHDSALLRIALTQADPWKLILPRGRFYLANAGFPSRCGILTPFTGHIYHLKDFRDRETLPDCEEEVFNYGHAKLRQVVAQEARQRRTQHRRHQQHRRIALRFLALDRCLRFAQQGICQAGFQSAGAGHGLRQHALQLHIQADDPQLALAGEPLLRDRAAQRTAGQHDQFVDIGLAA